MNVRGILLSSVAAPMLALGLTLAATAASAQSGQTIQPDVRTTLTPGLRDAGQAASNLTLEYSVAPPPGFFDPAALFTPAPPRPAPAAALQPPGPGQQRHGDVARPAVRR